MKILYPFIVLVLLTAGLSAQVKPETKIYNPKADATADIEKAIAQAQKDHKHVLLQIGGNWCPWCLKMHELFSVNPVIDSILKSDYIFVLVNYSKENRNSSIMTNLGFPQRFGFPVLVVLDANGTRLHTQDSSLLEGGKQHDPQKVITFLKAWTVNALDPGSYKE
jgi:hypothetical protein